MCVGRRWVGLLRDITVCMTINGVSEYISLGFSFRNTLNLDYSHEPAYWNTHTHRKKFIRLRGAASQHRFNMQASSWWYQINGEFQIRHSRSDRQKRPSLVHINRTFSFPSRSQLFLFDEAIAQESTVLWRTLKTERIFLFQIGLFTIT